MPALRYRGDCENCGAPVHATCPTTRTCGLPECSYAVRTKRYRAKIAAVPAVHEPVNRPEIVNAAPVPLVPPLTLKGGHVTPTGGRDGIRSRTHLVIPDCQVHDGVPTDHLEHVGKYVADKRPDVIVCLGDFADMPSLSSYDKGKKRMEGQRYVRDIEAARAGMDRLTAPWRDIPDYKPRMVLTLGNHEDRITRAVEDAAILENAIGLHDLGYEAFGWEVFPFLEVVNLDGIEYSHFFTSGVMGRPVTSAAALLRERAGSAVMGHVQHTDLAFHKKTQKIAIFAGTCYQHDEAYLSPQGNVQRRQILMLHEVNDGRFDPLFVSLEFLRRKYGA